jgi:hypothetical protein
VPVAAGLVLELEDAAFRAVESRASMSCCAEGKSPFPRSVPS